MAYDMTGEGIPLVFIHQVATDRRLWHRQRLSLAPRYRLITVDVLGHGERLWPLNELSIEHAATHIQWLLERLGTGAAFLIGVSMGAAVAMRLALNTPALVRGLVLLSPWTRVSEHTRSLIERLFRFAEAGDMTSHTDLFLRYVLPIAYLERRIAEVERLRAMALEQNARAVAYTWAACLSSSLADELGDIRAPSLVIAGLNDLFTPPYLAREVAQGLMAVELEVWSETGHFPFLEDPLRFNRRLETFIRRYFGQAMRE
jgi:pimeloyl-ACP methyl ester carboxylesterase